MFSCLQKDPKSFARRGQLKTRRGVIETPAYMPVGTYGSVRGLSSWELEASGASIMLANTYHLYSRPGLESLERLGGLHRFSAWNKPIITDSGGFQVFSLSSFRKITDESVRFRDPIDGRLVELHPEGVVETQERWGSDIMMVLDECPPADGTKEQIQNAMRRTKLWAERSLESWKSEDQFLFPIVQGGVDLDLRRQSLRELLSLERSKKAWSGLAVGGLSVGETKSDFVRTLYGLRNDLPEEKVHYLMGVGTPRDLIFGVACGIDLFDCVIPSRNARHGIVMTSRGRIHIHRSEFREDERPLDLDCDCLTCQKYSRAFVRHLFVMGDALGQRLATLHNVRYFLRLMERVREHLEAGSFTEFAHEFLRNEESVYLGREKDFSQYPESYL